MKQNEQVLEKHYGHIEEAGAHMAISSKLRFLKDMNDYEMVTEAYGRYFHFRTQREFVVQISKLPQMLCRNRGNCLYSSTVLNLCSNGGLLWVPKIFIQC
jgi:enamine deaminase RidA (YjgF/YER057c/UK114 family)